MKVLFLMFLLLLMGLGAASVKAQVRIGGNAAPNASAVLDLNANDTNSGTKGLALPRVALTSNQMLLPGVTSNLTGMMVYNTSTTGTGVGTIGIYFWNGAQWVKANLPSMLPSDSGKVLTASSSGWYLEYPNTYTTVFDTTTLNANLPVTLTQILWRQLIIDKPAGQVLVPVSVPGLRIDDMCFVTGNGWPVLLGPTVNSFRFYLNEHTAVKNLSVYVACYRPSA